MKEKAIKSAMAKLARRKNHEKREAVRTLLVEMAKLPRTPRTVLVEFIRAHGITGLSMKEFHGMNRATINRLQDAFSVVYEARQMTEMDIAARK